LLPTLQNDLDLEEVAKELLEYAEEALRKAERNFEDYKTGREVLLAEVRDQELREIIAACQEEPQVIWQDERVQARCRRARVLVGLAEYTVSLAHFAKHPNDRIDHGHPSRARRMWQRSCEALEMANVRGLPSDPTMAFDGNPGHLEQRVRDRLVELLADVRSKVNGW